MNKTPWTAKRVLCWVIMSPFILLIAVFVSPVLLCAGLVAAADWVVSTATGWEPHEW